MHHFDEIYEISAARHGGPEQIESKLSKPKSIAELEVMPDDRWLSIITKTIFQAGFSWKVIEAKWDGFETAFDGFDIGRCAFMDDEKFDALLQDTRIVRNGTKNHLRARQRRFSSRTPRGRWRWSNSWRVAFARLCGAAANACQTRFAVGRCLGSICNAFCRTR